MLLESRCCCGRPVIVYMTTECESMLSMLNADSVVNDFELQVVSVTGPANITASCWQLSTAAV